MSTYKFRWTVTESEIYDIEADSLEEAKAELFERTMPDEIVDQKIEAIIPVTNIRFIYDDRADEVQFDTQDETELAQLWWQFCQENHIITDVMYGNADYDTGEIV